VSWGEVRQLLASAPGPGSRREQLEKVIDLRIMVKKAREAGLEQEPVYQRRLKEFRKSELANLQRSRLAEQMNPSDAEIREFYKEHRDKIVVPEMRKVQMVVVKTRDEAEDIKKKIDAGEITLYQAAKEYSIDPNAQMNLGELGWVAQGTGFPELDKVTFALKPGEIGGPVESPAGWHLVKSQEQRAGQFKDIDDRETWNRTRRMLLHDKEDQYVTGLRKTSIPVQVYDEVFGRLTREEVGAQQGEQPATAAPAAGGDG